MAAISKNGRHDTFPHSDCLRVLICYRGQNSGYETVYRLSVAICPRLTHFIVKCLDYSREHERQKSVLFIVTLGLIASREILTKQFLNVHVHATSIHPISLEPYIVQTK